MTTGAVREGAGGGPINRSTEKINRSTGAVICEIKILSKFLLPVFVIFLC